jgi:hypothetical protein
MTIIANLLWILVNRDYAKDADTVGSERSPAASPVMPSHARLRSNAAAAPYIRRSSKRRPVSISPTGSPSIQPQGKLIEGWPVALNGAVLIVMP